MDLHHIGAVIGWYMLIFGTLLFFRLNQMQSVMTDVLKHRAAFFTVTLFTLVIGLLLLEYHHSWTNDWTVAITIIAWVLVITAVLRLFFLDAFMKSGQNMIGSAAFVRIAGLFFIVVGLYLLFNVYHQIVSL